jgi:hypothetical protein
MPTVRNDLRVDYTPMHRAQLLHGHDLLHSAYGCGSHCGRPLDWDLIKDHWAEHRAELLGYWAQPKSAWLAAGRFGMADPEPGGPFTRPFAWWALDCPRPILEAVDILRIGIYAVPDLPMEAKLRTHGLLLNTEKGEQ